MKNIAFIGRMGSGKSTLATKLQDEFGYTKFSFASKVKKFFTIIYNRPINKAIDREELQAIGRILKLPLYELNDEDFNKLTNWLKSKEFFIEYISYIENQWRADEVIHDPTFYRDCVFFDSKFKKQWKLKKCTVDDMRFLIEDNNWKANGGVVVLIDVPLEVSIERLTTRDSTFKPEWLNDVSEQEFQLIKPDYILDGTKSIDELIQELKDLNLID